MGEWVSIQVGQTTARAYVGLPKPGQAPGVLLMHAWWGLNDFFQSIADRLAEAGFVALAPDYFAGETASTIEQAKQLGSGLDRKVAHQVMRKALAFLSGQPTVGESKIGIVAYSLGCGLAIDLTRKRSDEVGAVVLFYGVGGGMFDKVKASFQGHFAAQDLWGADKDKVAALEARIRGAGPEATFYTYPNTRHWFFEQDRPADFVFPASQQAWDRTVAFLHDKLEG